MHGATTSSPTVAPSASANPGNLNASVAYPNSYPTSNAYTPLRGGAPLPKSPSVLPTARLRATPRPPLEQRDSVLRASILDTALELGVGTNSAVEKWMFGTIGEVDEELEEVRNKPFE